MKVSLILLSTVLSCAAVETNIVDLPTVLRLAGAQNRDVQIARERLAEARANQDSATVQFFPWIAAGVAYRAHDNAIQDVSGRVIDVHKEAFSAGPTVIAQLDLGDAIYKRLAAIQLAEEATQASKTQLAETVLTAATVYLDLSRAQNLMRVTQESLRLSEEFAEQLGASVEAGLTFRGDALRARTQAERNRIAVRQALEQRSLASAKLAQVLHLAAPIELVPSETEFVPITLVETNRSLDNLVSAALSGRSELKQIEASLKASRALRKGAVYGPLIPSVGAQVFVGGLGGGNQTTYRGGLNESEDYKVTATWRLGPGGIFDRAKVRAADARLSIAELNAEKLHDEIVRQVVEGFTRTQSEADKLRITRSALAAAEEAFQLARGRKESAIGSAFEAIYAEQEFTKLRQDFVTSISEFNKAQYQLARAIGQLGELTPPVAEKK